MMNPVVPPRRVMVSFHVGERDDCIVERMHAVEEGSGRYVLDNSPFYAYGVSFGDAIAATMHDGDLVFSRVVARGGHSTYRVRLPDGRDHAFFLSHWPALEALGCSYEGSSAPPRMVYAIDVPPEADVRAVFQVLEQGEEGGIWDFEEAHYCCERSVTGNERDANE